MSAGHTPGPWVMQRIAPNEEYRITTRDYVGIVCTIYHQANARLITAAPDLLAFATAFVGHMNADTFAYGDTPSDMCEQARAAIAKATGAAS